MRFMRIVVAAMLIAFGAAPAAAQFSDSYNFIKAVREKDVMKAKGLIDQPGSTIVTARDPTTGEQALHIVTRARDLGWMGLLLNERAPKEGRDRNGNTPLILAAELGFIDGLDLLIDQRANVNAANNGGETALIKAVQTRNLSAARLLLDAGANPDQTDNVAGLSARDYAERDRRAGSILRLMTERDLAKKAAASSAAPALPSK